MSCFQKAINITPDMVRQLIAVLEEAQVDYIVAPYEADAQLCYLYRQNLVDLIGQ